MSDTPEKFYLTTPIYYVNARPHIGHAYTTIVADVIARRHRLLGDDTFFLTGTDEHGQKIERSAIAAGIPPQQFADQVSKTFRDLWTRMGILDDSLSKDDPLLHRDFIRTTDPRHKQGVQRLFQTLKDRGHIYLSTYTGQYCVSDEAYVDGPPGVRCPDCGRVTETVSESNYYFRLSAFQLPLLNLIESGQLAITPDSRRNEVLSFLRGNITAPPSLSSAVILSEANDLRISPDSRQADPDIAPIDNTPAHTALGTPYLPGALKDLSISRTSFHWGVPVPGDEAHVIYVWLDALANYMTAIGYGSDDSADIARFERFWPADLHLVGKEIIRFHCVYWPAFLLAAGLPTPKAITAHGWLLFQDSANEATKMSKSKGNIVRTETILDAFGDHYRRELVRLGQPEPPKHEQDLFATDVLRYFLLREIPFGQDGSFSFEAMITRYNADLANGYGNLVSRTLSMIAKFFQGHIPIAAPRHFQPGEAHTVFENLQKSPEDFGENFPRLLPSVVMGLVPVVVDHVDEGAFHNALVALMGLVKAADADLSLRAPWSALEKLTLEKAKQYRYEVLASAAESIRIITALLYPILPYATAKVWSQLGLGSIEQAARDGKLKDLQWGGLQPGTRLGPLAPIFPRADKGLVQIMTDMEQNNQHSPAPPTEPGIPAPSRLTTETTSSAPPTPTDSTHPGAPPRTSAIEEHHPIAQVAGSASPTTQLHKPPSHTEAFASGPFNTAQSSQPITQAPIQNPASSPSSQSKSPIPTTSTTPAEGSAFSAPTQAPVSTAPTQAPVSTAPTEAPVFNAPTEAPVSTAPTEGPGFSRAITGPAEGGTALPKAALPHPAIPPQATTSPAQTERPAPTEAPVATPTEGPGFSRAITSPAEGGTALPKAALPHLAETAQITIDDFAKVELRVARILVCERIPKADKLLRLEVDLGTERRQILSGIAEWYTPEELVGRRIVVITNLAPRKMRGLESHGMLLAASSADNGKPALATFADADNIEVGARLK